MTGQPWTQTIVRPCTAWVRPSGMPYQSLRLRDNEVVVRAEAVGEGRERVRAVDSTHVHFDETYLRGCPSRVMAKGHCFLACGCCAEDLYIDVEECPDLDEPALDDEDARKLDWEDDEWHVTELVREYLVECPAIVAHGTYACP